MPSKIYLFISLLCHAAVVAMWWFGPSLPTIELAGLSLPGQAPSQKQTVQVRLKNDVEASSEPGSSRAGKQPKSAPALKLDGQTAAAKSQQRSSANEDGLSVVQLEPTAPLQAQRKTGPDGPSGEDVIVSREPPPPIRYAGAFQATKTVDQPQLIAQQNGVGQQRSPAILASTSPSTTESPRPSTEVLPAAADGLRRDDGLQAPAFNVYLPPDDIDLILMARQGILLVLCEQEQYLVEGTLRNPLRVFPATSQRLRAFSERALQVPAGSCQRVCERLRGDFAVTDDRIQRCRFHLLLSNQVDYLVLSRQRAAADRLRCSLEQLAATFGRFAFMDQQVADYQIQSVALKDGRRVALVSASAPTGDPKTR